MGRGRGVGHPTDYKPWVSFLGRLVLQTLGLLPWPVGYSQGWDRAGRAYPSLPSLPYSTPWVPGAGPSTDHREP
jgi:hypothetical protein